MTLQVVFEPDEGGWHVYMPSVQGCRSHGRSIAEARRNIREALSTCEDVYGSDAEAVAKSAVFDEEVRLPDDARAALEAAKKAREVAETASVAAAEKGARAAKALRKSGLSLRDAGELLGLSHQRIKQLAG